jgi:glycerol 2-dehydrogenase (NADP+)
LWGTYHTRASEGIEDSLKKLGLDYVDRNSAPRTRINVVYLMHWPIPLPVTNDIFPILPNGDRHLLDEKDWSYIDTWKAMENLFKQGKCRAIGVSNMSIPYLERLISECEIVPAVNQVYPLKLQGLIKVECHPLLPQDELLQYCKKKGIVLEAYSPLGSTNSPLLSDPMVKEMADKHGASISQILISWQGISYFSLFGGNPLIE